MSDQDLVLAEQVGTALHQGNVDVNEVKKLTAFLRRHPGSEGGANLRTLLERLINNASQFRYSNQTIQYHRSIHQVTSQLLCGIDDSARLQFILGWAARLMRYYKDGGAPPMVAQFTGPAAGRPAQRSQQGQTLSRAAVQAATPPRQVALRVGEMLAPKYERIDGATWVGTAKGHRVHLDQPEPPLAEGASPLVIVESQHDGYWKVRLKKR